jgi:hypothetical protein
MPDRLGVRDEDVKFGPLGGADAGDCCDVDPGIADRRRDLCQGAGSVLDVDFEVD